jgi:hypothetical protein
LHSSTLAGERRLILFSGALLLFDLITQRQVIDGLPASTAHRVLNSDLAGGPGGIVISHRRASLSAKASVPLRDHDLSGRSLISIKLREVVPEFS